MSEDSNKSAALKIILYIAAVVILGSALAGPLFISGKKLASLDFMQNTTGLKWLAEKMSESGFARYFNRALLIVAFALIIPLIKSLRIKSYRELGWQPDKNYLKSLAIGFAWASVLLLMLGFILAKFNIFEMRFSATGESKINLKALMAFLMTGFAVSFIEEFLFRGVFLGLALRILKNWQAILLVSFIFAIVHFLQPPPDIEKTYAFRPENVSYFTGFLLLGEIALKFGDVIFWANFATLFSIGIVLALITISARSIWAAIGMHAGWIFGLRVFKAKFQYVYDHSSNMPWIGDDLKIGIFPIITVIITYLLVHQAIIKKPKNL